MKIGEVAESMRIFWKYLGDDLHLRGATHDKLWGPPVKRPDMAGQDAERLEELGWLWDEEEECWIAYI